MDPVAAQVAPEKVEQPQAAAPMSVSYNKNSTNLPLNAAGEREFNSGFFACLDDATSCLYSWCLPCCFYSLNKRRLTALEAGAPLADKSMACDSDAIMYSAISMCGCCWVVDMSQRAAVRARYGIAGEQINDAAMTCGAACCLGGTYSSQIQVSKELAAEEAQYGHQSQ